ncbi:MAG: sulfite exporter TauE/SafE family protein [Myxococcota bacterium]|nr:sulfite exporter TauE/SafE family protein [Myxococcota bacterium]
MTETPTLALLAVAGVGAGWLNAIAGAGSLLTLPALIHAGLDATSANATNRLAVLVQCAVSLATYVQAGQRPGRATGWLVLAAATAALPGAWLARMLAPTQTQMGIAVATAIMAALVLLEPSYEAARNEAGRAANAPGGLDTAAVVALGFYAGLLQAGVGILVLTWFVHVRGQSVVSANGLKYLLILATSVVAIVVFAADGSLLDLPRGLALALGTAAGSWLGTRVVLRRGERIVRTVIALAVVALAVDLALDAWPWR